jgi:hypothetical protein
MRAFKQTKQAAILYPLDNHRVSIFSSTVLKIGQDRIKKLSFHAYIQTVSHDCHQDNPLPTIMELDIIHVLCQN